MLSLFGRPSSGVRISLSERSHCSFYIEVRVCGGNCPYHGLLRDRKSISAAVLVVFWLVASSSSSLRRRVAVAAAEARRVVLPPGHVLPPSDVVVPACCSARCRIDQLVEFAVASVSSALAARRSALRPRQAL